MSQEIDIVFQAQADLFQVSKNKLLKLEKEFVLMKMKVFMSEIQDLEK